VLLTSRCVIGGNSQNAVTRMWLDAEAAVRDSGLSSTILRPSGFSSNALRWLPQLREGDVIRAPWPAVPTAVIDPADGEYDDAVVTTTVRDVTGRPARTFGQWAQAHAGLFADPG
jgi:uncharacterized protein YbjT (DUF2867 family)